VHTRHGLFIFAHHAKGSSSGRVYPINNTKSCLNELNYSVRRLGEREGEPRSFPLPAPIRRRKRLNADGSLSAASCVHSLSAKSRTSVREPGYNTYEKSWRTGPKQEIGCGVPHFPRSGIASHQRLASGA
jgi:hypothetical protein